MTNFKSNLPHLIMAALVIGAAIVLVINKSITGGEAVGMIGTAAGFSLGTGAASASITAAAQTAPITSLSSGGATATSHPAVVTDHPPAAAPPAVSAL